MDTRKREKIIHYLIILGVFVGLLAYFCVAHPLILSDTDDWYYASHWRRPLPVWGEFNGVKVFPEFLMAFCGMLSSYLVEPIKHDYLMSLALVYGIMASLFVTVYVICVSKLMYSVASKASRVIADVMAVCFLMLHFLMYKNEFTGNVHLLWATDVTCLFHYTFSALLSACLVMFFMRKEIVEGRDVSIDIWKGEGGYLKAGLVLLLVYLAVFSNMFNNIILAAFAGIHALVAFVCGCDKGISLGERFKVWLQRKWLFVGIVFMWLIAVVIQTRDPRNDNARSQGATGSITGAIGTYVRNFTSANKMAALIIIVMVALFVWVLFRGRKTFENDDVKVSISTLRRITLEILISFVVTSIYLVILCGIASPGYLSRNDVKIGVFFYILLEVVLLFGWAIGESKNDRVALAFPILTFILAAQTLNYCKPYKDFNMNDLPYEQEVAMSTDLMEQFIAADEAGLDEFELHVVLNPNAGDNWPYPSYAGDLIGDALFRHGVISRPIKAKTVFDESKNKVLGITFK